MAAHSTSSCSGCFGTNLKAHWVERLLAPFRVDLYCQRSGSFRRLTLLLRNMAEWGGRGLCRDKRNPDSDEHSLWVGEPSTRGKFMLRLDRPRRPPRPTEALELFMNSRLECRSSRDCGLGSSRFRPLPPPAPLPVLWCKGRSDCWGVRGSLRPVPVGMSFVLSPARG